MIISFISICKQKTFSPVLAINSSQKDKALTVKTSKPNFSPSLCISETACLISYEISLFVTAANREGIFAPKLREFGVNQWIVQDIHWLSTQSERTKNTIHCFSIY